MRIIGTMRVLGGLPRVSRELRLGGEFEARFTSGWEGRGRIDACEAPNRLRVSTWEASEGEE